MTEPNLLFEMSIVGFIGIVAIAIGLFLFTKHLHEKDWDKARPVMLASTIFVSIVLMIFETIWLCMYLGLPV